MTGERTTRGRMSRIEQLPPELKARIDELLRAGVSQREILRRLEGPLQEIGEQPLSRSGLNRYATDMAEFGRDLREIRAIADAWRAKPGEQPTGEAGQLTVEILQTLAFRMSLRARRMLDEDETALDPALVNELSLALQRLERAAALGTKRERELRAEFAAQAESIAKRKGVTADTAAAIREALTTV